jgi:hypothetical protein
MMLLSISIPKGSNDGIGQSNDRRAFRKDELRRVKTNYAFTVNLCYSFHASFPDSFGVGLAAHTSFI